MTKPPLSIKTSLHQQCLNYINKCINNTQHAIEEAIASGNNETKSSAGDKHETGRSLLQLEQEKNTRQLMEMQATKERLIKIEPCISMDMVVNGSAVITSNGNFYIAIAAGKLETEGVSYNAVSPSSPIAKRLMGLKEGDETTFNDKTYQIRYVL